MHLHTSTPGQTMRNIFTITCLCLTLTACGSEVPEGAFETPGGALEVTTMQVLVKEIVADGEGPNNSLSRSIPGTFDIDVIAGTSEPEYPIIELEAGDWSDLNFGVEVDDDVAGREAIRLEGNFYPKGGGDSVPLRYLFNSNEVFEIEQPGTITLGSSLHLDAGQMFHPDHWFPTVDLRDAQIDDEGWITLSQTQNVALFNEVSDALDRSTQTALTDGRFLP
jgi:hypothetical protein